MKPILFKPHMVNSIFDDIKTQTRRIVKQEPTVSEDGFVYFQLGNENCRVDGHNWKQYFIDNFCPFGKIGDLLWVREAWRLTGVDLDGEYSIDYQARGSYNFYPTGETEDYWIEKIEKLVDVMSSKPSFAVDEDEERCVWDGRDVPWKPSIHMPKEICRLFLKITDIRIERLQEISYTDAAAEGVEKLTEGYRNYFSKLNPPGETFFWPNAYHSFQSLWESIHGSESWESNPWLWVIEFEKTDKPANWPQ